MGMPLLAPHATPRPTSSGLSVCAPAQCVPRRMTLAAAHLDPPAPPSRRRSCCTRRFGTRTTRAGGRLQTSWSRGRMHCWRRCWSGSAWCGGGGRRRHEAATLKALLLGFMIPERARTNAAGSPAGHMGAPACGCSNSLPMQQPRPAPCIRRGSQRPPPADPSRYSCAPDPMHCRRSPRERLTWSAPSMTSGWWSPTRRSRWPAAALAADCWVWWPTTHRAWGRARVLRRKVPLAGCMEPVQAAGPRCRQEKL